MSQKITIQSPNFNGEQAQLLFKPDNDNVVINLSVVTFPYTFDSGLLTPSRDVYGSYTILVLDDDCPNILNVPRPTNTPTPTPTPVPAPSRIYYGKFTGSTITSGDVTTFNFVVTNNPTNSYVTFNTGSAYGYILIPITLPQPNGFRDSDFGCSGFNIPINNIGQIIIIDGNGFPITYNIYRTFYSFFGDTDCWLCN